MLTPTTHTAADVIACLDLAPLPHEGGWFRRTHAAPAEQSGGRAAWSMIFALFTPAGFSALHRLAVDELWIFQAGDPLELWCLSDDGRATTTTLGHDCAAGQRWQAPVAAGVWQGARVVDGGRWALVTCVVVPEFRWEDFQLGDRAELVARFPSRADEIRRLTRA